MIKLNGVQVVPTIFPDGTSQIWHLPKNIIEPDSVNTITWDFTHEAEFLHIAQLKQLISNRSLYTQLDINYLPYARQDKDISDDATFALHTFAYLLNMLAFDEVTILDPHSNKALELIENSTAIYPIDSVMQIANMLEADLFCYPDNGAYTKYTGFPNVQDEIYDYPCITGEKVRNQTTGHIESYKLIGDCKDKKVLIVDDICDYGRTFILLATELKKAGVLEINLFITHGLFNGGIKCLKDAGINRVFSKDGEAEDFNGNVVYKKSWE